MTNTTIPGGLLIAVEGIDGAGKTTLARSLAERLRTSDVPVVLDKEPTAGPWGMKLRASAASGRLDPDEEVRLLLADRRQHVDEVIGPALARGEVVILDRYYPSMAAYQGAVGVPVSEILAANDFAPEPDVTLVLDISPALGLARIRARGDAPNAFETEESLAACRKLFLAMPLPSRQVIDAQRSADDVLRAAAQAVLRALAVKLGPEGLTVENAERVRSLGVAVTAL